MLTAEYLYQLPLDLRVYIANMNMDVYIQMYVYDDEFKLYTFGPGVIDSFIDCFVAKKIKNGMKYVIGDIEYYKYDDSSEYWYKDNLWHKTDGPAVIILRGKAFYVNGELHRMDEPAIIDSNGTEEYWQYGQRHRVNGPAVIHWNGTIEYWQNGLRHNRDGPAVIKTNGNVEYWQNGKLHRADGRAVT